MNPRILPVIEIAGIPFTVDVRLKELREQNAPWNIIRFNDLDLSSDGSKYGFLFNKLDNSIYYPHPGVKVVPHHVVAVEFPNELKLDTTGYLQSISADPTEKEIRELGPQVDKHTARLVPLSEWGLKRPQLLENAKGLLKKIIRRPNAKGNRL